MNRWSEAFDNHQFHTHWNSFNKVIESIELGAEANENVVTEFSRLVKCQKLIDSIIGSVDKDTFHLQTLANAQAPIQQAHTHLTNFRNDINNLSQIQAANSQIDQVLNFFRPYMVMPDAVAKSVKEVSKSQQKLLEQLKKSLIETSGERLNELKEIVEEAKDNLKEIEDDSEKSNTLYQRLFGEDGSSGLNSEIDSLHTTIKSAQTQASQSNQVIQKLEQQSSESNTRTQGYESSSKQSTDEIEQLLVDTEEELKELNSFYLKVFGKPNEEGELVGGMKVELEEYKQAFNEYEVDHKSKIEELIKEIESLLPGAVSAGLASEYKKLKDECTKPINSFTTQFYWALAGLLAVGVFSFYYSITNVSGIESILHNLLQVSPLLLPAVWFAVFTSRRRNELERLRQEYAHKQAVTSSYQSFKEQIDRLGEKQPEMLSALMNTAIKTIGDNASKVLSNNSKESSPVHETISAVGHGVSKVTQSFGKDTK
jgi:DNA repair exonuclease SbcCD ATPase subunit